ncbi:MAG: hypothetical protein WC069_05610 [Candidatus Shapirobacteria bacterium]
MAALSLALDQDQNRRSPSKDGYDKGTKVVNDFIEFINTPIPK